MLLNATIEVSGTTSSTSAAVISILGNNAFEIYLESLLDSAERLEFTYQALVRNLVRPEQVINNAVVVDYTSVGSSYPLPGRRHVTGDVNYLPATDSHNTVMERVAIVSALFSTSIVETPTNNVNINEEVVYQITTTIPEVDADVTITVQLPVGVTYRNASVVSVGADITGAALISGQFVDALSPSTVQFVFGELRNVFDNDPETVGDQLVVQVVAQLDDEASSVASVELVETATIDADATSYEDTTSVVVREPSFDTTVNASPSAPVEIDADDLVTFDITLTYTGDSTSALFDLYTTAFIDDVLDIVPGSVQLSSLGATFNISADLKSLAWYTPVFVPSDSPVTFQFQAIVLNNVVPDRQDLITEVENAFDSLPLRLYEVSGRNYTSVGEAPVLRIAQPAITFVTLNSSLPESVTEPELTIHEVVQQLTTVTLPEVTSRVIVTVDVLNRTDMALFDHRVVVGAQINCTTTAVLVPVDSGGLVINQMVFDFGVCENLADNVDNVADTIAITTWAAPLDVPALVDNSVLVVRSNLDFSFQLLNSLLPRRPADRSFEVVEPHLETRATIDNVRIPADAGDNITYRLTTTHLPSSLSAAYDLVLVAVVHPDVDILVADPESSGTVAVIAADRKSVTYTVDTLTLLTEELTVSFTARILNSMVPDATNVTLYTNTSYDSHLREQRFGLGGRPDVVEHVSEAVLIDRPTLQMDHIMTSDDITTGLDIAIHETFTSTATARLIEGTSAVVLLVGMEAAVDFRLLDFSVGIGASIDCSIDPPTAVDVDANGDGLADAVRLDFGICVNAFDSAVDSADLIVVTVVSSARNRDVNGNLVNFAGDTVTVGAELNYTRGLLALSDVIVAAPLQYTVVEPVLALTTDVVALALSDGGDTVRFGLTLTHQAGSGAAAYDIVLTTAVPPLMTLVATRFDSPAGGLVEVDEDGRTVRYTLPSLAPDQGRAIVSFDAVVDNSVYPAAAGLVAAANATFDSQRLQLFSRPGRASLLQASSPAVAVFQPVIALVLTGTSDTLTDGASVAIHESASYFVGVVVPEVSTRLRLEIDIPDQNRSSVTALTAVVGSSLACEGGADSATALPVLEAGGDRLVLDLGFCRNVQDNARTAGDRITVTLTLFVEDVPLNTQGSAWDVTARIIYTDSANASTVDRAILSAGQIAEPTTDITLTDPVDDFVRQGQAVELPGELTQSFGHDVVFVYRLPQFVQYNFTEQLGTAALLTESIVTEADNTTVVTFRYGSVPVGDTIQVVVHARISPVATPGQALRVNTTLAYDSSPATSTSGTNLGRPGGDLASFKPLFVVFLGMEVTVTTDEAVTEDDDLAVAEAIVYDVLLLIKGPAPLLLTLVVPKNPTTGAPMVQLEAATIVAVGSAVEPSTAILATTASVNATSEDVTIDFGDVNNLLASSTITEASDGIRLRLDLRVIDGAAAASGAAGAFELRTAFAGLVKEHTRDARIVLPELQHEVTYAPSARVGDAGDVFVVTHSVTHTSGSTLAAFDLDFAAALGLFASLQPQSGFLVTSPNGTISGDVSDFITSSTVAHRLVTLPLATVVTATYTVVMDDDVPAARDISVDVGVTFRTRPGGVRRTTPLATLRRNLTSLAMPVPIARVTASDGKYARPSSTVVTVGETFVITATVELIEGRAGGLLVDAALPLVGNQTVLAFVEAVLGTVGSNLALAGGITVTATSGDARSTGLRRRREVISEAALANSVSVDLGDVTNSPDNQQNSNDTLEVLFTARVLPSSGLANGQQLTFQLDAGADAASAGSALTLTVAEPVLASTPRYATISGGPDGTLLVQLVVPWSHVSDSIVPAFNVSRGETFFGNATFALFAAPNVTDPESVYTPGTAPLSSTYLFTVDRTVTTSKHLICVETTANYTTPPVGANNATQPRRVVHSECFAVVFPSGSEEGFLDSSVGQAIIFSLAAVALVALLAGVLLVRRRRRKQEEKRQEQEEADEEAKRRAAAAAGGFDYETPTPGELPDNVYNEPGLGGPGIYGALTENDPHLYQDAADPRRRGADDDTYNLATDRGDETTYELAGRGRRRSTRGGQPVNYDMAEERNEEDAYALASRGHDDEDVYGLARNDIEDDYALATRAGGAGGDEADYALAGQVRRGSRRGGRDDDEDDYALADRSRAGRRSSAGLEDDYALAGQVRGSRAGRGSRDAGEEDDYALAGRVGGGRTSGHGYDEDDYAFAGKRRATEDVYNSAGQLGLRSSDGEDEVDEADPTYSLHPGKGKDAAARGSGKGRAARPLSGGVDDLNDVAEEDDAAPIQGRHLPRSSSGEIS